MMIGLSIMTVIITAMMIGFKTVLLSINLRHEAVVFEKYLNLAQQQAATFQIRVWVESSAHQYLIKTDGGEVLKERNIPSPISLSGYRFAFTPRLTPTQGGTFVFRAGSRQAKVIIDPVTGRIRLSK
jgi:type II secretory pathway pseudopilin PulG